MGRKMNNSKQTFRNICDEIRPSVNPSKQPKLPEYYVITEGQTEKWYLTHLKNARKISFTFSELKSVNGGDYLKKIAEEIDNYYAIPRNKIICIFDVDRFYNNPTEFDRYSKFMRTYSNVNIYNNMPSIEYWFLLHYSKKTITKLYTKTELFNDLTKHSPFDNKSEQVLKSEPFLKPDTWFKTLCGKNFKNLNIAIDNAKNNNSVTSQKRMDKVKSSTDCDVSYSDMYKLFEIK